MANHGWLNFSIWGLNCNFCNENLSTFWSVSKPMASRHKSLCERIPSHVDRHDIAISSHIKAATAGLLKCQKFQLSNTGFNPSQVRKFWFCANPKCNKNIIPFSRKCNAQRHVNTMSEKGCHRIVNLEAYVEPGEEPHGGRFVSQT